MFLNVKSVLRKTSPIIIGNVYRKKFSAIIGHATAKGTENFLQSADVHLSHHISKPNIYINPIIVQPSETYPNGKSTHLQFRHFERCLKVNRCNCFTVYQHDGIHNEWYFSDIQQLMEVSNVSRENIVLMAKIGISIYPLQNLELQIQNILKLCNISNIDIVILEVSSQNSFY
jgi:hypothetical protein